MTSPLAHIHDHSQDTSQAGHNDPFYSIDFGDPAVTDSDGTAPTFQNVSAQDHVAGQGVRVKLDSTVTFNLVNQHFKDCYTDKIDSYTVAIEWKHLTNPNNDGVWQIMNGPNDPIDLCMSYNPRLDPGTFPQCQYVSDRENPVKNYFIVFQSVQRDLEDNDFHWHFVHMSFKTGEMKIGQDNQDMQASLNIMFTVPDWAVMNNHIGPENLPVVRSGKKPTQFILRKGSDDYWVRSVRIFKNLPEDNNPLIVAWRRVKNLN